MKKRSGKVVTLKECGQGLDFENRAHISRDHSECANTMVLALFLGFMNFWSNAPKFCPIGGGGVCVYFLKSVRKGRFRNVGLGGGGVDDHILSKWSCKVDNAQDRAMLEGPLIILNPNRRHCCPFPHGQGPHWGTHPPASELEHIFSVFPNPAACMT